MKNFYVRFLWNWKKKETSESSGKKEWLQKVSGMPEEELFKTFRTTESGLTGEQVKEAREAYGENILANKSKPAVFSRIWDAFVNPFTVVLMVLAVISAITDIWMAGAGEKNYATVAIIVTMVTVSGVLRFVQETKSTNVAERLSGLIHTMASVVREGTVQEIPMEELVVGDLVLLSAGDMIPADLRIISARDLFVSQSALTGESEPVEKTGEPEKADRALTDRKNLAFMGSNVVSGSATALAAAVGSDTLVGEMAKKLEEKPPKTSFEKGIHSVSWVLIRFMLVMVPVVLFLNGFTKDDWVQAALFAVSVAVGLTPEMLPMIVTTSLAKGALTMSREKVIVKNLNAIQNLGSIDILCADKTGTLTQDRVILERHLNIDGKEDDRVLRHAFLNSYFQTGLKNLIDLAVIEKQKEMGAAELMERYQKVDEIPFDFERRRMSVVVKDESEKTQMVTKGAVEEMLTCCSFAECGGKILPLTDEVRSLVLSRTGRLNERGMRVIAVAQKTNPSPVGQFSAADEADMVLIGFLAFLDPPKETGRAAVHALNEYGIQVKVLTGDNERVTCAICHQVGIPAEKVLLGEELERMEDGKLAELAEETTVFAKLSPSQKARVVRILRENGHSVGYMGDGINDAAAMKASDVGISVDSAVDIAKESAAVVLLEKDLMVLKRGVTEGRKTYVNMMKYIKMTASSNFGNMFSVVAASIFLPFLPMAALHLLLLNLIYDISCTAISWDHVDEEYIRKPRRWDASGISRFMLWIGPVSSVFDILTYLFLYFVLCPAAAGGELYSQLTDGAMQARYLALFQTGWFVESMWSQTMVIHMIRTPKLPFVGSRASAPVLVLTALGIGIATLLPFLPFGAMLDFVSLPAGFFGWLAVVVAAYMALMTVVKGRYIRRYGEWL